MKRLLHTRHAILLRHGFKHKVLDTGAVEYTHPALPTLITTIGDYDSYAACKAVDYALEKLAKTKGQAQ